MDKKVDGLSDAANGAAVIYDPLVVERLSDEEKHVVRLLAQRNLEERQKQQTHVGESARKNPQAYLERNMKEIASNLALVSALVKEYRQTKHLEGYMQHKFYEIEPGRLARKADGSEDYRYYNLLENGEPIARFDNLKKAEAAHSSFVMDLAKQYERNTDLLTAEWEACDKRLRSELAESHPEMTGAALEEHINQVVPKRLEAEKQSLDKLGITIAPVPSGYSLRIANNEVGLYNDVHKALANRDKRVSDQISLRMQSAANDVSKHPPQPERDNPKKGPAIERRSGL